jgi:hypothetical protein
MSNCGFALQTRSPCGAGIPKSSHGATQSMLGQWCFARTKGADNRTSREVVTFSCGHSKLRAAQQRRVIVKGCMMNPVKTIDKPSEMEVEGNIRELVRRDGVVFRQAESDGEITANNLSNLMRRVSGTSTREIDDLIAELQTLREKLQVDGNRVQRDIMEYAALSQSVVQLTKIISESVRKLPAGPGIGA